MQDRSAHEPIGVGYQARGGAWAGSLRASARRAAVRGASGSRCGYTRPIIGPRSGSAIGMARTAPRPVSSGPRVSGSSSSCASRLGITLAQRPLLTCETSHDHGVAFQHRPHLATCALQPPVDDAPVLHVQCQQAEWERRDVRPADLRPRRQGVVARDHQAVRLLEQIQVAHPPKRLASRIGEPGIRLQVLHLCQDFQRGAGANAEGDVRVPVAQRCGQPDHHRQAGGDDREPQMSTQTLSSGTHLLAHGARVAPRSAAPIRERVHPRA